MIDHVINQVQRRRDRAGDVLLRKARAIRISSGRISSDRAPVDETWASGNNNAEHVSDDCVRRLHAALVSVLCTCARFVFRFCD